jgi:hypothetical protein
MTSSETLFRSFVLVNAFTTWPFSINPAIEPVDEI